MDTRIDALKTTSKKVVYKADGETGEIIGEKTADKIVNQNPAIHENSGNVEEIIIPPEKREEILNAIR